MRREPEQSPEPSSVDPFDRSGKRLAPGSQDSVENGDDQISIRRSEPHPSVLAPLRKSSSKPYFGEFDQKNLQIEIDVAIEALEIWIWPLPRPEKAEKVATPVKKIEMSETKNVDFSQWKVKDESLISIDAMLTNRESEPTVDIESEESFSSVASRARSTGPFQNRGMKPSSNVIHPSILQFLRLQAFTTSNDVGSLTGSKASGKGLKDEQPVTGVILSMVAHVAKNPISFRGTSHLVELNMMLGRPEGLGPAPSVRIRERPISMSTIVPIDEGLQRRDTEGMH